MKSRLYTLFASASLLAGLLPGAFWVITGAFGVTGMQDGHL